MSDRITEPEMACPFVAFDDDRDHRGPGPDHRHRCFAETPAAPRALAHQAAYCLSASFPGCPTFIDWARREAAPVRRDAAVRSLREAPTPRGTVAPAAAAAPAAGTTGQGGDVDWSAPPPSAPAAAPESDEPVAPALAPAFLAGRTSRAAGDDRAPLAEPYEPPDEGYAAPAEPHAAPAEPYSAPAEPYSAPAEPYEEPRRMPVGYAPLAPSRSDRRPVAGGSSRSSREHRDPAAPSWEEPRRVESYPTIKERGAGGIPRPLVYALIVLFAGVALFAAPFILQGLTGGGEEASPTPAPTASVGPTPETSPTPEPTPEQVIYVVKAGDTLSKIAAQYGVAVDQILAANPQIKNANQIAVGDQIIIPQATPSEIVDDSITPAP